jgi:hypothetical protein
MEKEFTTYEQALALKELGFNEPCFGYWKMSDWLIEEKTRTDGYTHADQLCSAPLKQQAFRWFRNEHDLFGNIDLHVSTPVHWYVRIDNMTDNDYLYHSEDEDLKWFTYEEAESAAIDKLIEIIKHEQEM